MDIQGSNHSNKQIEFHAHIKDVNNEQNNYAVIADGALTVDGICIYEMIDFSVSFNKLNSETLSSKQSRISQEK